MTQSIAPKSLPTVFIRVAEASRIVVEADESVMKIEAVRASDGLLRLGVAGSTVDSPALAAGPSFRVERDPRNPFKFRVLRGQAVRAEFNHMFAASDAVMFAGWCNDPSTFPKPMDDGAVRQRLGLSASRDGKGTTGLNDRVARVRLATFFRGSYNVSAFSYATFYATVMGQRRVLFEASRAAMRAANLPPDFEPAPAEFEVLSPVPEAAIAKPAPKVKATKTKKRGA